MSESAAASFVHSVGEKRVVLTAANSNEAGVLASSNAVALVTTLSKYAVSTCNMQLQQNIASERADALQLVLNYKDGSSQLLSIDNTKYTCQAISQDQNSSETQDSVYSIQFAANAISDAINSAGLTLAQVANIQSIDAQLSIVSNN
ncbi:MAG: hypothetical protein MJ219_04420 [Mycoplasmoidaceae bacterium]|nr:hypothetical protein [Mycoplasmoidaceae bacterium]